MTRVIVTGQLQQQQHGLKPIEFISYLSKTCGQIRLVRLVNSVKPYNWDNVQLLGHANKLDLIYAWDDADPREGWLYLGHWNDGVVS